MQTVTTTQAPEALGHYAQAITHNGLIYVSGQLPIDPQHGDRSAGTIEEQTVQTLKNIEAILTAGNSDKSLILKMTVYIADLSLWGRMNEAFAQFMGEHKPARAAVPVSQLPKGYLVEIDAIAALK